MMLLDRFYNAENIDYYEKAKNLCGSQGHSQEYCYCICGNVNVVGIWCIFDRRPTKKPSSGFIEALLINKQVNLIVLVKLLTAVVSQDCGHFRLACFLRKCLIATHRDGV